MPVGKYADVGKAQNECALSQGACLIFLVFWFAGAFADSKNRPLSETLSLKYIQSIGFDTTRKFKGTKVGGLSGLVIRGSEFYTITDDRGRYGEARLYHFKLRQRLGKGGDPVFDLLLKGKISLFKKSKNLKVYDMEALAPFRGGWLVSSEGDWNSKPVTPPEVLFIKDKEIKQKVELPPEFLPQFKGKQISGLYNNKAFEGMAFDEDTQELFLLSESGLLQRQDGDSVFYLLEYKLIGGTFVLKKNSKFDFKDKLSGTNSYNGASDILRLSENSFLILTRSVESALPLQYGNTVWLVNRKSPTDEWEVKSKFQMSGAGEFDEVSKTAAALDLLNQNYEGMAILHANGKKYLVLVSDDNFNSFEKTVFSFFELEVK